MQLLSYIKIHNFKCFGDEQRIDLAHPSVIIGPNNCGKTTVLQALALWSQAVRIWCEERIKTMGEELNNDDADSSDGFEEHIKTLEDKLGSSTVMLNRLSLVAIPVPRTRCFWHNELMGKVFHISVGVIWQGREVEITMGFDNFLGIDEGIFCSPCFGGNRNDDWTWELDLDFLKHLGNLHINLLHPMSGIDMEETVLKPARVNVLLGQGRTAEVLRNLCLTVWENSQDDWSRIVHLTRRLFSVELSPPRINGQGLIVLGYRQVGAATDLDISSAGRGFLQTLLIFAYLYSNKNSVLLIDEPDAHLEVLRQKQVRVLLRDIAHENNSQVVMVTHSEVILNESLVENLTLLLDGKAENLAKKQDIRNSLKHFGAEHYIKARECGNVFYVEGGTDIDNLRELATLLNHPVAELLMHSRMNTYYVENNHPALDMDSELEHIEGGYGLSPVEHFNSLRGLIKNLKGLAILDSDGKKRTHYNDERLNIVYWKRYEIENYFITPEVLLTFTKEKLQSDDLFNQVDCVGEILKNELIAIVFEGNTNDYERWSKFPLEARDMLWEAKAKDVKLSLLAETFFESLAQKTNQFVLLRKGEFYRLVRYATLTPAAREEVGQKLDLLHELLTNQPSIDETTNP